MWPSVHTENSSHSQRAEACSDTPDLQTAELQSHPVADFTRMVLHVVTTHLSKTKYLNIIVAHTRSVGDANDIHVGPNMYNKCWYWRDLI